MRSGTMATALVLAMAGAVLGQGPSTRADREGVSRTEPAATPEIWFYQEQLRRYEDPRVTIRQNAEQRAEQRRARIAAMKWYGFSNSRPQANPTPWGAAYSPMWTSNSANPFHWTGGRPTTIIVPRPEPYYLR